MAAHELVTTRALTTLPKAVNGLGFRVWGLGFGVQGVGFRVNLKPLSPDTYLEPTTQTPRGSENLEFGRGTPVASVRAVFVSCRRDG